MCNHEYNKRNYIDCPKCYHYDNSMQFAYYDSLDHMMVHTDTLRRVASYYYRNRHRWVTNRELLDYFNLKDIGCFRNQLKKYHGYVFHNEFRQGFRLIDIQGNYDV